MKYNAGSEATEGKTTQEVRPLPRSITQEDTRTSCSLPSLIPIGLFLSFVVEDFNGNSVPRVVLFLINMGSRFQYPRGFSFLAVLCYPMLSYST